MGEAAGSARELRAHPLVDAPISGRGRGWPLGVARRAPDQWIRGRQ
jgi:hypothetical protein